VNQKSIVLVKTALWLACLAPLVLLVSKGLTVGLGANPIEYITLDTGTWTLNLILATLSITPLRRITGRNWLIKLRRPMGLFAFFYGCMHFTTYIWLDKFFDINDMLKDVAKRPFITAGFLAFILMIPLASTSTAAAVRLMGGKNWQWLHRLIYVTGASAVVHFWWKVKADHRNPAIYGAILIALLLARLVKRKAVAARSADQAA
jgi:sulfoxide reductase heme-binding subunit YedZ